MRLLLFYLCLASYVVSSFEEDEHLGGHENQYDHDHHLHDYHEPSRSNLNQRRDELEVHEKFEDLLDSKKERADKSDLENDHPKKVLGKSEDSQYDYKNEDAHTAKKRPRFPMHRSPFPVPPMFLPPWFWMPTPPQNLDLASFKILPAAGYIRPLDASNGMDEELDHDLDNYEGVEDLDDEVDEDDNEHHYEDPEDFSSGLFELDHPYGDRRRQRRSLVDVYSVRDSDDFWQDIDGGRPDGVSQRLMNTKAGYAAYAETMHRLDHYAAPQHIGYIDTGHLEHSELYLPKERAFGKGFDFSDEDMRDSFYFKPTTGQRFYNFEHFIEYIRNNVNNAYNVILNSRAITKQTECSLEVDGSDKPVNCAILKTPAVYKLDYTGFDYYRNKNRLGLKTLNNRWSNFDLVQDYQTWILFKITKLHVGQDYQT